MAGTSILFYCCKELITVVNFFTAVSDIRAQCYEAVTSVMYEWSYKQECLPLSSLPSLVQRL